MRKFAIEALKYGLALGLLLLLLRWLEWHFYFKTDAMEVLMGATALVFTGLGIWLASRLTKPKIQEVIVEKEIIVHRNLEFEFNQKAFETSGLTERELEVLSAMALGLSNQEIADKLFLSVPTIKTHASNIFDKLDVRRRTQAIEKGKSLNIIP